MSAAVIGSPFFARYFSPPAHNSLYEGTKPIAPLPEGAFKEHRERWQFAEAVAFDARPEAPTPTSPATSANVYTAPEAGR